MQLSLNDLQTIRNALEIYERSASYNYIIAHEETKELLNSFKSLKSRITNGINSRLLGTDEE